MDASNQTLFSAAMSSLEDSCPANPAMYLCAYQSEMCDEDDCTRCWRNYLYWIANGRRNNPYQRGGDNDGK